MLKIWENYVIELYDQTNRPETLEVEPEEEVDTDKKGPYILQSEVEEVIKEMRNRKAQVIGRRWFENIDKSNEYHI